MYKYTGEFLFKEIECATMHIQICTMQKGICMYKYTVEF